MEQRVGIFSKRSGHDQVSKNSVQEMPRAAGFDQWRSAASAQACEDPRRNGSLIDQLPISQRLPRDGEFHVVWQVYLHARDGATARVYGLEWLTGQPGPWGSYYGVIDSTGSGITVEGIATREWSLSNRNCDPGEYLVMWDGYFNAPGPVEAKQAACQCLEQAGDELAQQLAVAPMG
jgi:hypothetical protein